MVVSAGVSLQYNHDSFHVQKTTQNPPRCISKCGTEVSLHCEKIILVWIVNSTKPMTEHYTKLLNIFLVLPIAAVASAEAQGLTMTNHISVLSWCITPSKSSKISSINHSEIGVTNSPTEQPRNLETHRIPSLHRSQFAIVAPV